MTTPHLVGVGSCFAADGNNSWAVNEVQLGGESDVLPHSGLREHQENLHARVMECYNVSTPSIRETLLQRVSYIRKCAFGDDASHCQSFWQHKQEFV